MSHMNKLIIICIALIAGLSFAGCERKAYVEHKIKFEKVADDCKEQQGYFRMNSNFGGERYEFEKCLPANFSDEQLVSERNSDTVVFRFKPGSSNQANKVFHITLDVDSYPAYHFVTIDGDTYSISAAEK